LIVTIGSSIDYGDNRIKKENKIKLKKENKIKERKQNKRKKTK
jgi:hypothetical protein